MGSKNSIIIIVSILLVAIAGAFFFFSGQEEEEVGTETSATYTVGIASPFAMQGFSDGVQAALAENGYTEENITYVFSEFPQSREPAELEKNIAALLENDLDVMVCITTSGCAVAKGVTAESGLPVVFMAVTDPVEAGLVEDFSNLSGNITGVASAPVGSVNQGRALEWLMTIFPETQQVVVFYNPQDNSSATKLAAMQTASAQLNVELIPLPAASIEEFQALLADFPAEADAFVTFSERFHTAEFMSGEVLAFAIEKGLPHLSYNTAYGQLLAYNVEEAAIGAQAANLVERIFKGAKPNELPVEVPEFKLYLNLTTAEAMGVEISDEFIRQASIN